MLKILLFVLSLSSSFFVVVVVVVLNFLMDVRKVSFPNGTCRIDFFLNYEKITFCFLFLGSDDNPNMFITLSMF